MSAAPEHVLVYGNDHSPWVQAVLLGLQEKGIPHTLVTVPPLSVFLHSGVLMPAARIDDGPWLLDSERILVALGFPPVDDEAREALGRLFLRTAMRRTDGKWAFWRRFSTARDGAPRALRRLWNHFWRAFSILYFFVLISIGRRARSVPTREQQREDLVAWQERLPPGQTFFGGDAPQTVDLQLFGIVQMLASIPVPALELLCEEPELERLRAWAGSMQEHFRDSGHLYTASYLEPRCPPIARASAAESAAFWLGAASMWLAFPLTVPAALFLSQRVRRLRLVE